MTGKKLKKKPRMIRGLNSEEKTTSAGDKRFTHLRKASDAVWHRSKAAETQFTTFMSSLPENPYSGFALHQNRLTFG
jgi:hypothetical protein